MSSSMSPRHEDRERIRLRFFRDHRSQTDFSSAAVRRDRESGAWFLDISTTGAIDVAPEYMGLETRVRRTVKAVNAVAPFNRVSSPGA